MRYRVYAVGLALLTLALGLAACGQALDATATATEASPTEQAPEGQALGEQAPLETAPTEVPAYAWNQLLSRDSIRPIYDPEFVPANEAGYDNDELVMGVALDGEAKAYPVSLLNSREMVNDELAGTAILVSWWPLCYTGLVHDRTVGGEELVFGNQGALFMNAMTWWDHKTESIWSQPWGRAIAGPLTGTELGLLPSQLVPWKTWRAQHPNTLALKVEGPRFFHESFFPGYVIGVTLGDQATAYPYEMAEEAGLINDRVGQYPVVVYVEGESRSVRAYVRQVEEQVLTFVQEGDKVVDEETGSSWALERGLALEGPLAGQALQAAPYIPAFPDAWQDFYPESRWWEPADQSSEAESPDATAGQGNADVLMVRAVEAEDGRWTFQVTVEHPDTGWEDYANGWDVVTPEGEVLKPDPDSPFTRLLLHPHESEQPFTRSQSGIATPDGVRRVLVRAHDLVDGYGGQEVWVDLTVAQGEGFEVKRAP